MDIASRILAWGVASSVVGGLALVAFQAFLIVPYLDRLEERSAQEKASQVVSLFDSEARAYGRTAEDWAYWEDSVRFVEGENPSYIDENLYPAAYVSVQIDAMVFFHADRSVHWAQELDATGQGFQEVVGLSAYRELVARSGSLQQGQSLEGFLPTDRGYELIAVSPIHSDLDQGRTKGHLMLIRHLGPEFWASFQSRVGFAVEPRPARPGLQTGAPATATASADRSVSELVVPMTDLQGQVSLELVSKLPRSLEVTGLALLAQVTWGSIGILLLTTLGNMLLVRRTLVQPVRALWRLTRELEVTGDWSLRAASHPQDEIGQLASGINGLIASVQEKTEQLEALASRDALTGLANRRTFDASLVREWRLGQRERRSLGFIMADVDLFKKFNDRYGHRMGDACLKAVAQVLQDAALRPSDVKARYGGEEFALILPSTDLAGTLLVADRIRLQVENMGLPHEDNPLGVVTISLGCVAQVPQPGRSVESLVEEADRQLYRAKADGRNLVRGEPG